MTIKNISTKIINIGTTVLLPDNTMPGNKALCEAPAIKAMVKRGQLSIIEEPKAPKGKPVDPNEKKPKAGEEKPKADTPAAPAAPATETPAQ